MQAKTIHKMKRSTSINSILIKFLTFQSYFWYRYTYAFDLPAEISLLPQVPPTISQPVQDTEKIIYPNEKITLPCRGDGNAKRGRKINTTL